MNDADRARRRRRNVLMALVILILLILLMLRCPGRLPQAGLPAGGASVTPAPSADRDASGRRPGKPGEKHDDSGEAGLGGPLVMPDGTVEDWLARAMSPQEFEAFRGELGRLSRSAVALPVSGRGASPLAQFLPARIGDAPRQQVVSLQSESQARAGMLGEARAFYGDARNPALLLALTDGGMAAAGDAARVLLGGDATRETPDGRETVRDEGGRVVTLRWRRAEREASAAVLLRNRVRVTAITRDVDSADSAERAMRAVDWDAVDRVVVANPAAAPGGGPVAANDVGFTVGETLRRQVEARQQEMAAERGGEPASPGADPATLLAALPAALAGYTAVVRQSRTAPGPGGASTPTAEAEFKAASGGMTLRFRLEQNPPSLGILGTNDRTWELMQRLATPSQRLAIVNGHRTMLVVDGRRQRAEFKVLLDAGLLLTASATGADAAPAAEAAAAALDWKKLAAAAAPGAPAR